MIGKAGTFWRTVRHLRAKQAYGRFWFWLAKPSPNLAPPPALRRLSASWRVPARRRASLLDPGHFWFLNEGGMLKDVGWDDPVKAKIWRYNQHYFDDLNAEAGDERIEWHKGLIADWLISNPPGNGSGWEPYPTSLRIVNWIKWALAGNPLSQEATKSLAVQTRWLTRRLEWHLLGNHLFANAKALVFAGLFFEGAEADAWLSKALRVLENEIPEQILPDGGQFELSPMYHALAVEDLLDLINLAQVYGRPDLAEAWRPRLSVMLSWLESMSHPDGCISFFNDAAFGIAPSNAEILQYAARLGIASGRRYGAIHHLKDSGYVRLSAGQFSLIADFGRIGPDYLPGHAHADTLSFELSIGSQRVFINSGTSEYGTGPERQRQRGTTAHNAVVIAGENSSEVWAGFRVGRRARPRDVKVEECNGVLRAEASHDGYKHLPGRPMVTRCIELDPGRLVISDRITTDASAEARYHLHPSVGISSLSESGAILGLSNGQFLRVSCQGGPLRVEATTWHPEFGISEPNSCLVLPLVNRRAVLSVVGA